MLANARTAIDFSPEASLAAEGDAPPRSFGHRTIPAEVIASKPTAAAAIGRSFLRDGVRGGIGRTAERDVVTSISPESTSRRNPSSSLRTSSAAW